MTIKEPHMIQVVDLLRWHVDESGEVFYDKKPEVAEHQKHVRLPMDCPAYMRVLRITKEGRQNGGATIYDVVAHTIELDVFTFGVKVLVRIGKDGTLKVFTEDSDGREVVASYTRET